MSTETTHQPWAAPGWLAQAHAWIAAALAEHGLGINGPLEQPHIRPWSTVLRVPTPAGPYFFKAVAPTVAHEPPLTETVARWHPDHVLPVLAVDAARGWMLLPDGGDRLREAVRHERSARRWEALLPRYAELQIALAGRVPELLALATPDRRLQTLRAQYEALLADDDALGLGQADGLLADEARQLHALAPRLGELCAALASCGVPESLHHGDLHDGNVFLHGEGYRLFDWGDSCVAHPFFSLRTALVSVENTLGLPEDAPELARLRDAYLEPWTNGTAAASLRTAFAQAQPLAALCGALTWQRALSSLAPEHRREYARAVPSLLREFLAGVAPSP